MRLMHEDHYHNLLYKFTAGHPLSTYAKYSKKLTFLIRARTKTKISNPLIRTRTKINISNPLIRIRTCAYQEDRNVSFSENFACVLNEWALM